MAKFKISVEDACLGCGSCTVACDNFVMENDKAKPVKSEVDTIGCNQEAADGCPVNAIKIEKIENGEQ